MENRWTKGYTKGWTKGGPRVDEPLDLTWKQSSQTREIPISRRGGSKSSIHPSIHPYKVANKVDPEREERDAVLDLHHVMLQTAILKAVSLCIRSRSWAVLPCVAPSDALEDASGWLVAADARADL